MTKYTLEEISASLGRNSNIVESWFEELETKLGHFIETEDGKKVYDDYDLKIILYVSEKRDERWSFEDIFSKLGEIFSLQSIPPSTKDDTAPPEEKTLNEWGRDPETLFYEIAQDNDVIQIFKYHSLRVMFLSSMLAKRVDCYDEDVRVASMLHDIGKMGISKNILFKSEKLTELEFTIIQSHSHVGNVIVRKHLGMTRAAKFIRDHHERWDGTGYPRRLLGDEITLQGRIISICDAFDTMTIDQRNYMKTVLSNDEAFSELRKCSWTQFDGNLVNLFIDMMGEVTIPEYLIEEP